MLAFGVGPRGCCAQSLSRQRVSLPCLLWASCSSQYLAVTQMVCREWVSSGCHADPQGLGLRGRQEGLPVAGRPCKPLRTSSKVEFPCTLTCSLPSGLGIPLMRSVESPKAHTLGVLSSRMWDSILPGNHVSTDDQVKMGPLGSLTL